MQLHCLHIYADALVRAMHKLWRRLTYQRPLLSTSGQDPIVKANLLLLPLLAPLQRVSEKIIAAPVSNTRLVIGRMRISIAALLCRHLRSSDLSRIFTTHDGKRANRPRGRC